MTGRRFSLTTDPSRTDAYCTPGDHRILNIREGRCGWCGLALLALCPACIGSIGGAHGGPDAPYRPALEGEPCGAADCQGAPDDDDDDDEPDAYEVWNATGSFPK